MYELPPQTFRDIEMFTDMLNGMPVVDLSKKYGIARGHVYDRLRRTVRRMHRYFDEAKPEVDFTRYRKQSCPSEFLKDQGAWFQFLLMYKDHCDHRRHLKTLTTTNT